MTEGIKLNFSDDEKASEGRSIEPIPTGEYVTNITKISLERIKKETTDSGAANPNFKKPYWSIQFAVQDGPYKGRRVFGNVMLFEGKDGTLSSLSQLMKATDNAQAVQTGNIPPGESLMGKQLICIVQRVVDKYKMKGMPAGSEPIMKNEIRGYKPTSAGVGTNANASSIGSGKVSLLP